MGLEISEEAELRATTPAPVAGPPGDESDDHETTEGLLSLSALLSVASSNATTPCAGSARLTPLPASAQRMTSCATTSAPASTTPVLAGELIRG